MKTNVEKVLERDQKLSELDDRADALQQGASQFEQQAGKLKRKFWLQNLKVRKMLKLYLPWWFALKIKFHWIVKFYDTIGAFTLSVGVKIKGQSLKWNCHSSVYQLSHVCLPQRIYCKSTHTFWENKHFSCCFNFHINWGKGYS